MNAEWKGKGWIMSRARLGKERKNRENREFQPGVKVERKGQDNSAAIY